MPATGWRGSRWARCNRRSKDGCIFGSLKKKKVDGDFFSPVFDGMESIGGLGVGVHDT